MDASSNLSLPFIMAAQAQKHVTHNEALRALDAIVQLAVADKDLDAPPGSPDDGACYIVAASPTGAWSGQAGRIAAWQDGAWAFYAPREGWLAWVADEDTLYVWNGAAWAVFAGGGGGGGFADVVDDTTPQLGGDLDANGHAIGFDDGTGLTDDAGNEQIVFHKTASAVNQVGITNAATGSAPQIAAEGSDTDIDLTLAGKGSGHPKAALFGINATADATTKFAVAAEASLFNHAGAGHQHKINKAAAGDTASLLFQTATSGRAEMGTAGDDDFHFKVSADGSTWKEAIVIDRSTGAVAMPLTPKREVLTANRTYYIRADGSDSNTGLADTSGGAFLTIQKAINVIAGTLDIAGFSVTIQVADGTYTGPSTLKNVLGYSSPGCLVIQGNSTTPANVLISTTGATCFTADNTPVAWDIKDLKMQTTTSGACISASGTLVRFGNVNFGTCAGSHMTLSNRAAITALSNYAVSGGAAAHVNNIGISFLDISSRTVTFSNSPAISFFVITNYGAQTWAHAMTFTNGGTVTGTRYSASSNGAIFTNGGGAAYLPGNAGGSTGTGGQYI
jgi:hypothetical protein